MNLLDTRIYYKVVTPRLTSLTDLHAWAIQYEVGKWIKPKCGKIFVCSTLEDAKKISNIYEPDWRCSVLKVFKCQCKGVEKEDRLTNYSFNWFDFWSRYENRHKLGIVDKNTFDRYLNSYLCNQVKLIEEIAL